MKDHTLIAVDVAKAVFEIVVSQSPGKVHERARVPRSRFLAFFVQRPAANFRDAQVTLVAEYRDAALYRLDAAAHSGVIGGAAPAGQDDRTHRAPHAGSSE